MIFFFSLRIKGLIQYLSFALTSLVWVLRPSFEQRLFLLSVGAFLSILPMVDSQWIHILYWLVKYEYVLLLQKSGLISSQLSKVGVPCISTVRTVTTLASLHPLMMMLWLMSRNEILAWFKFSVFCFLLYQITIHYFLFGNWQHVWWLAKSTSAVWEWTLPPQDFRSYRWLLAFCTEW